MIEQTAADAVRAAWSALRAALGALRTARGVDLDDERDLGRCNVCGARIDDDMDTCDACEDDWHALMAW